VSLFQSLTLPSFDVLAISEETFKGCFVVVVVADDDGVGVGVGIEKALDDPSSNTEVTWSL